MYLTYLDDGGKGAIKVFGGVVIDHSNFVQLETSAAFIMHEILGTDNAGAEFHASDMFLGERQFAGIPEEKRHSALRWFIQLRNDFQIPYVYSAVDTNALNNSPLRSASWMDTAFFMCACAIDEFLWNAHASSFKAINEGKREVRFPQMPVSLIVVDEPEQQREKGTIRNSFQRLRQPLSRAFEPTETKEASGRAFVLTNRLRTPVDDVFFGDSKHSLGLQFADACNWTLWRQLCGNDAGFFRVLAKGQIICAKPEPEWSQYGHLFRSHEQP